MFTHSHVVAAQYNQSDLLATLRPSLEQSGVRTLLKGISVVVMQEVEALLFLFPHPHFASRSRDQTGNLLWSQTRLSNPYCARFHDNACRA